VSFPRKTKYAPENTASDFLFCAIAEISIDLFSHVRNAGDYINRLVRLRYIPIPPYQRSIVLIFILSSMGRIGRLRCLYQRPIHNFL
jgi:hypothetical protein